MRKKLGFPTVFNLLGPLLNPAGVKRQVVGTFSPENADLIAQVMAEIGDYEHAIVLTSDDGLDEASLAEPTNLFEIKGTEIEKNRINPGDYGLKPAKISELQGGDAENSANIITRSAKTGR